MQMKAIWFVLALAGPAAAEDVSISETDEDAATKTDLRLTLTSFLFRETGSNGDPLVAMGASVPSASPVRRYFGDLRVELTDGGFELDARVRQTTSQRYQSGAAGGGEYEIRTMRLRVGSPQTALYVGRQYIEAVGATKIDGLALERKLSRTWSATLFGGAFPQLGSRSLDTDYPDIKNSDGSLGSALVPISGGLGASYSTGKIHGSLGAAAVYAMQDVPEATSSEASRVFLTANGYTRPTRRLDLYHFALADIAGNTGANLTNGSLGINVQAATNVQLSASVNHVSTDLLQIAARNLVEDPDPNAMGIVQNNAAVVRVSQDLVRGGASVALARQRFEISLSGGYRRRPGVAVALTDGGTIEFPDAKAADATIAILDRRSIAKLRISAAATVFYPLGDDGPSRSRGSLVRVAAGRSFADSRGELEADVMVERFRDATGGGMCTSSMDVFSCYGASKVTAVQAGALASWRVGREWLVLVDTHAGARAVTSSSVDGAFDSPRAYSITAFARLQWRYR
jgi:hypothetical protein